MKIFNLFNICTRALLIGFLAFPTVGFADNVRLTNKPLVDSTVSDVLPNLMFVLDNSGSMGFDYTPDWSNSSNVSLKNNAIYNTQYYNPKIRYTPAVRFDGVSYPEQTTWTSVKNDFYNIQDTGSTSLVNNSSYFTFLPGEYCTTQALTTCIASTTPTGAYLFPAPIRWCNTSTAANTTLPSMPANGACRAIREGAFTNLRTPRSTFTLTFNRLSGTASVTSIKVNGMEILSGTASGTTSTALATAAETLIDVCNTGLSGNCNAIGYAASRNSNVLTITAPAGKLQGSVVITTNANASVSQTTEVVQGPGSLVYVNIQSAVTSYPEPGSLSKAADRTDCTGATCTYAQEMTNYANWWTYYQTRMQGMKTSASLAFKVIDNRYRVGFITINNSTSNYLPIGKFESGNGQQKNNWYTRLFATLPSGGTPLRSALGLVGRIYANKAGGSYPADPVEYACQPSFTLLTTDGYWNGAAGTDVNGSNIGNLDGTGTPRPLYEGGTATSGTLADVAKYYFDNDLRKSSLSNCTGALGQNVCGEGAGNESFIKQNMTTLTLGLGIDGTLFYEGDYATQATGDFADIKSGVKNWPVPELIANASSTEGPKHIDDLWHAAVNGNGSYFSARSPKELSDSLRRALSNIQSKVGTGSASSASSLQPTAGDNFEYTASYETVKWIGNLESRTVNTQNFETSEDAGWCAEDIASASCTLPAQLVSEVINNSTNFYCKTSNTNATNCNSLGGVLTGTDCRVEVESSCAGTMKTKVAANSDTRTIYMNKAGSLIKFDWGNLDSGQQYYYSSTFLSSKLSQWPEYTSGTGGQQEKAVGVNFINYLRGHQGYEDRSSNLVDNRIYRYREATLGDITESQPAFVAKIQFNYVDSGFSAFKTSQNGRSPTVYVGANDGMLHAFNATTGQERWAFVPTPAISKMWKLADKDYATNHVNLVNGDPVIAEIYDGGWKTILVAGLGGGGRGYYALDITNPDVPKLLWEKTATDLANLGYTFGLPVVTKLNNGTWVVLLTSGYNNGTLDNDGVTNNNPGGNGQGYLYVLNAGSGALIKTIGTGEGNASTPSGFAPISTYIDDLAKNNTALFVIGGDLNGNVFKIDINAGTSIKLATLRGPTGLNQAITTFPQLGLINKNKVAFIGTGKYLEVSDLTNIDKQSLYALKVDGVTPLGVPRGGMVPQVISGAGEARTVSSNAVDFTTGLGWYLDFPEAGERTNVESLLIDSTLIAPTIVPASTSCSPGGFGYLNFFNYKTGGSLLPGGVISEKTNSPIVGLGLTYGADGKAVVKYNTSDNATSQVSDTSKDLGLGAGSKRTKVLKMNDNGTYGRKYMWRELAPDQ